MKSRERIKQKSEVFFDEMALRREIIPEPDLCYEHILPYFKELSGGRVADIGCGMGKMLAMIEQQYPGKFHLSGIDLSTESLRIAREVTVERLSIISRLRHVRIRNKHITITKHEPHHAKLGISIVNFVDDLIAHLLVASTEQLRKRWARNATHISKR